MRGTTALLALLLVLGPARMAKGKLKVVATVGDLAALARAVGGERIEVFALTLPTQDPHFVDARPHLALKLNRADLLLVVGLGLESGWLPVLLSGARNPRIQQGAAGYLDLSTVVSLKEVPRSQVDRSMGDIHPGGNPHYLVDPGNAERAGRAVAARLARLDPQGAQGYAANARGFVRQLSEQRRRWEQELAPYRGAAVVSYHRSWIYLTDWLGLKVVEHLEPKPGVPPSSAHVLQVLRVMKQQKVAVVLQEAYYPDRTATVLAQKTGARLVLLPGSAGPGQSYPQRMEALVRPVLNALKARGK